MNQEYEMIVKASFRGNPPEERKSFFSSTCLMPISVGQSVHENEKFSAVIKLVNASFKECVILVDDSVQRHTLAIHSPFEPQALYGAACELGQQWLVRNKNLYSELKIPYQILRWDAWLNHPDFNIQYERVNHLYHDNQHYKDAIHTNVDDFLRRYLRRDTIFSLNPQRAFRLCVDYLLEECAVMCLWIKGKYHFELYPSNI